MKNQTFPYMVLLNFIVVLHYHSCMHGVFLFFTVRCLMKFFFSFSIQTEMTRHDKLEFNLYCEKLSTLSLSKRYYFSIYFLFCTSNQGVFSSLLILSLFLCFYFLCPQLCSVAGFYSRGLVQHRGNMLAFHVIGKEGILS